MAFLLRLTVLPHGSQFMDLVMMDSESVLANLEDIVAFFYSLKWPAARHAENAVGRPIHPSQLLQQGVMRDRGILEDLVKNGDKVRFGPGGHTWALKEPSGPLWEPCREP